MPSPCLYPQELHLRGAAGAAGTSVGVALVDSAQLFWRRLLYELQSKSLCYLSCSIYPKTSHSCVNVKVTAYILFTSSSRTRNLVKEVPLIGGKNKTCLLDLQACNCENLLNLQVIQIYIRSSVATTTQHCGPKSCHSLDANKLPYLAKNI